MFQKILAQQRLTSPLVIYIYTQLYTHIIFSIQISHTVVFLRGAHFTTIGQPLRQICEMNDVNAHLPSQAGSFSCTRGVSGVKKLSMSDSSLANNVHFLSLLAVQQIWTCEKAGAEPATRQVPSRKCFHSMNFYDVFMIYEFLGAESCSSASCEPSKACSQQRGNKAPCFWRRWVRLQQSMGPLSNGHLAWISRSDNFAYVWWYCRQHRDIIGILQWQ